MNSSDEELPDDILKAAEEANTELLPVKSRIRYEKQYEHFVKWCKEKGEIFQRTQETQGERRVPHKSAGIVSVPRGSRGPRSLYLRRYGGSFGFTLRHFIVYPPESVAEDDGRHAACGALLAPMDTIFVRHVRDRSAAKQAGLQRGDRLVAVNGVSTTSKSYQQVVQLIANSPEYLHVLVVPKEEDVLQRFFPDTAYNPISNQTQPNQPIYPEVPVDRVSAQQILKQHIAQKQQRAGATLQHQPHRIRLDADSWRSLHQPYGFYDYADTVPQHVKVSPYNYGLQAQQKSAESILQPSKTEGHQHQIYAEIHHHPNEVQLRQKNRAAPQVPLYRKMGRRASEGSTLVSSGNETYSGAQSLTSSDGDSEHYSCNNMKAMYKPSYLPSTAVEAPPSQDGAAAMLNAANCRLSMDVSRRESTGSMSSSVADSSKDSLASFGSNSTLTGHEIDDSVIMSRFRQSVKQKEEFLRSPGRSLEQALIQREFYGRPKKLERALWPPNDGGAGSQRNQLNDGGAGSARHQLNDGGAGNQRHQLNDKGAGSQRHQPNDGGAGSQRHQDLSQFLAEQQHRQTVQNMRAIGKPVNQNFARVRSDIVGERDLNGGLNGGIPNLNVPNGNSAQSPNDRKVRENDGIREGSTAPDFDVGGGYGGDETADERRMYPTNLQIVHKRTKDFEIGRPLPDDNRTDFSKSELARLSSKKLVPNVCERAQEYETKTIHEGVKKDTSTTSTASLGNNNFKKIQRDSRSLGSSGSNASNSSISELLFPGPSGPLSGNVLVSSGSKYIHCPPPGQEQAYASLKPIPDTEEYAPRSFRPRSNSVESYIGPLRQKDLCVKDAPGKSAIPTAPPMPPTSPLIPITVEQFQLSPPAPLEGGVPPPTLSVTPASPTPMRPNRLNLEALLGGPQPQRPARTHTNHQQRPKGIHLDPNHQLSQAFDTNFSEDKPVVVKRRIKNTNLAEDDRIARRESYLKATEGGRMHIDSDFSDGDGSPNALRSESASESSSSASLDRDKASVSPLPHHELEKDRCQYDKEGFLHCKILEIDGKRAADRSWKQVMIVLKGPKLFLFKDRHHQSPTGSSDVSLDQSLSGGVDLRTSVVRVADDYHKRKNVLKVSAVKPCRSEFLLQAESSEDFAVWVKTLQERVAASTDGELDTTRHQQAVPQLTPASSSVQVQGSQHSSPQLSANQKASKTNGSNRNRSPTGQSPVSKTRKPSGLSVPDVTAAAQTSPKSKTWRGRVAKQFRKFNQSGAQSPSSPTAPEGSTFGIPIEECIPSNQNQNVPRFVEVCTEIIDEKGLQTVGIYRVPGNNASITALTEEINKNYEEVPLEDPRWNDVHVVSSLLKSYFRKMPDSLVTSALYPHFIKADKIDDPKSRMEHLRALVRKLPSHNYHTLKHVMHHLKRIVDNSEVNRMDAKNIAIVFGPTIVRPETETMENMVNNMTSQCKIVESLITNADWFFPENDSENVYHLVPLAIPDPCEEFETHNQALLNNIQKYHAIKDQKEKNGALLTSLFSAAQKKVMKKHSKGHAHDPSREEATTPTSPKPFVVPFGAVDGGCKEVSVGSLDHEKLALENTSDREPKSPNIPTTVMELEKRGDCNKPQQEKMPWFNYSSDKDDFYRRIENFRRETEVMLQRPRKTEISVGNIESKSALSCSASNVNHHQRLSLVKPQDLQQLTKTHSATNVFSRNSVAIQNRNSFNSLGSKTLSYSAQYDDRSEINNRHSIGAANANALNVKQNYHNSVKCDSSDPMDGGARVCGMRRGSSVENLNCSTLDLNSNNSNGLKKLKYESEIDGQRRGSLDSLNKLATDDESLLSTMTKLIDEKLKEKSSKLNILSTEDIPYVDASPEKKSLNKQDKENIPNKGNTTDLYKNPSLHKGSYTLNKLEKMDEALSKEGKNGEKEKDEDTRASENVPDNERHISLTLKVGPKLKRSESLNKPEKTTSPLNNKVKRSESLNKANDKLKRSDSLTKTEKTENNINKKRESLGGGRRLKDSTKYKRKNGMPDRSIKRRHTVGGTKDPDKITWVMDNKNQENNNNQNESNKEKGIRTSSPDLSSSRRERFLFEINLIGPENMVVALRQHLIGSRPQSFPEAIIKVPLESHV